jgi:hypothetical protein
MARGRGDPSRASRSLVATSPRAWRARAGTSSVENHDRIGVAPDQLGVAAWHPALESQAPLGPNTERLGEPVQHTRVLTRH